MGNSNCYVMHTEKNGLLTRLCASRLARDSTERRQRVRRERRRVRDIASRDLELSRPDRVAWSLDMARRARAARGLARVQARAMLEMLAWR